TFQVMGSGVTINIHDTPKRSATMPKSGDQNVLAKAICTCPPSDSAAYRRFASASSVNESDREKPRKDGGPSQRPSETMSVVLPMRRFACITLSSAPGAHMPGTGLSL